MKPTKTWVLIADGARARVLMNTGPGQGLHPVEGLVFHGDHAATHDIVDDREGRTFSSHGPGHSSIEARSDPHRDLKTKFAHQLAGILARGLEEKAYDRLVIVAAPSALGDLRTAISDHVRATVVGEVNQDLTKLPNNEVGTHIKHVLIV